MRQGGLHTRFGALSDFCQLTDAGITGNEANNVPISGFYRFVQSDTRLSL